MLLPEGLTRWLWPSERRRANRKRPGDLAAFYWDGAEPRPRQVRDVSVEGMYLMTEERWYPNTLIAMTLTRTDGAAAGSSSQSVHVTARVVRAEDDGVGFAFVFHAAGTQGDVFTENVANKESLKRFVAALKRESVPMKSIAASVADESQARYSMR